MGKTILWANDFPPVVSGIATFFYNLWVELPKERTVVIAPKAKGYREFDRQRDVVVKRIWLPLGESIWAKVIKTLLTLIWSLYLSLVVRPRKFHCGQVLSSGIAGLLCKRLFKIAYVVYVYGSETFRLGKGRRGKWLMRKVLNESQTVVSISDSTSKELEGFGVNRKKIVKICPGVDSRRFCPKAKDKDLTERLGLDGMKVILTVARLDQRKGHDMVMKALSRISREKKTKSVQGEELNPVYSKYVIVGKGIEEERLKELSGKLEIEDTVLFTGYVPDDQIVDYYNLCDVFVMPNRVTKGTSLEGDIQGFGISFVEAAACEKPAIAGRSGGTAEAVLDGVTGILVEPESEKEIADAIRRLIEDEELALKMGRAGRERAKKEFDWQKLAKSVEEIL